MNTRDILNAKLYPTPDKNARTKDFPLYDTQTIVTGRTEYFFFVNPPGDIFLRNTALPLAGTNVFFINGISAYIQNNISTTALAQSLNELLQESFLEIQVDNRQVMKIPGLDFINYLYTDVATATQSSLKPRLGGNVNKATFLGRKLPLPIIINSSSSFSFRFVTTTTAATAFNNVNLRLCLHGVMFDKLESFYWDNLKNNLLQEVPVTYYYTVPITTGNATTYELFRAANISQNLFSQVFPLSDIQTFALQSMEVFVNQPDTPIEPTTIFNSRLFNQLVIEVDDVSYYQSNLMETLSLFAGFTRTLTTTPDIAIVEFTNIRQSKVFLTPLNFPANSKVRIALTQPNGSLGVTGEITVALRGIETRRVA